MGYLIRVAPNPEPFLNLLDVFKECVECVGPSAFLSAKWDDADHIFSHRTVGRLREWCWPGASSASLSQLESSRPSRRAGQFVQHSKEAGRWVSGDECRHGLTPKQCALADTSAAQRGCSESHSPKVGILTGLVHRHCQVHPNCDLRDMG